MNQLTRISPISDADAARMVRVGTLAELASQIVATPVPPAAPRTARQNTTRRRLALAAIAAPVAAGVAAIAVVLASAGQPPQAHKSSAQPPQAHKSSASASAGHVARGGAAQLTAALTFTSSGGHITVTVVNPLADPSRYRAEFVAHHLDVSLTLVPVSPSLVGTLVYIGEPSGSSELTPITATGRCFTGGAGAECPVGVRIPDGFRGHADITFGRAAKPGEQYDSTAPVTAPGEAMHGLAFQGRTVTQVLGMLDRRHITVALYNGNGTHLRTAPGSWYVYDADPWAPGQVMLSVGPIWPRPALSTPAPNVPVSTPSAKP